MSLFSPTAPLNRLAGVYLLFYQRRWFRTSLSRRILLAGDPNASAAAALEQWVGSGKPISKHELQKIINELSSYRRFKHALEVSLWMSNQGKLQMNPFDVSVRLKLIYHVFGITKAEDYFDKIPENSRRFGAYLALLNIYSMANSADKAESIVQKAKELGYATKPVWYNLLMKLHYKLGNKEKLAKLLAEMEEKGVPYDEFTHHIWFLSYAEDSDIDGMDRALRTTESSRGFVHWRTYAAASKFYLKAGSIEKALLVLDKLEEKLTTNPKDRTLLLIHLIDIYAEAGKKGLMYRAWNSYKPKSKAMVNNKVYLHMIRSLIKLGEVTEAEKIFQEWVTNERCFDFRVPNLLIDYYCSNGEVEKAEEVITSGVSKGGEPWMETWCFLAYGYLKEGSVDKAVEALEKAVFICPQRFEHRKDALTACLRFLRGEACLQEKMEALEFVKSNVSLKEVDFCGL